MKLLPIPLSPLGAPPPMGMWSSDLLWRYPPAPPSPLAELRTQLPPQLLTDPRIWGREEVAVFLRWSEREFDLPKFELDLFQMNGKAICLLSKTDFAERCPAAGDVLHNVLHMLVRDAQMQHRHLPSSPVTPTSRYPLSPHSQPPTPNWSALAPPDNPFYAQHLQQFMASNSVTLSPAPSTDSQVGSPPQHPSSEQVQSSSNFLQSSGSSGVSSSGSNGAASNNSDSDEEPSQYAETTTSAKVTSNSKQAPLVTVQQSTNNTGSGRNNQSHHNTKHLPPPLVLEPKALAAWSISGTDSGTPTPSPLTPGGMKREFFPNQNTPNTPLSAGAFIPVKREFFPDTPEPNTNGRLLWDFLQQLLNDPQQRYSNYIAWKCRDTGVFKIVDPAGLAKLWGIQKNHLSMNYDKMSRALRYYYRVNILRKVQGERHCYQFLRNPSELKSIKNISLLRQTMANQQAQQQQQQQQQQSVKKEQQAPPQSPSYLMNGSIASIMTSNVTNFAHLSAAAAQQRQQTSPVPPSPLHLQAPPLIKMEAGTGHDQETDDMKPTDLSTNSSSSRNGSSESVDCYPLIRNSNGLTTIQILRHHQENNAYAQQQRSASVSPQPYIKQSSSPVQQQQQHHQSHESLMDEMPTDLSKSESSSYYK